MNNSGSKLARMWHLMFGMFFLSACMVGSATSRGPDQGGYTGTDATVYSFVDISGSGGGASILAGTDDATVPLTIPFAFQFYNNRYSTVCVSGNGALYFVSAASACKGFESDFANTDLTTTSPPADSPAALPFWSDLTFQVPGAGAVFYRTLGQAGSRRFVVQWNYAYPQGSINPVTFQAILYEGTNNILFQYQTVNLGPDNRASHGALATVGIRNSGALTNGQLIQWSCQAPVVADHTALLFSTNNVNTQSPRGILQSVSGDLSAIRAGVTAKEDAAKLDDAISSLKDALGASLWVDQDRVQSKDGGRVFDATKQAVGKLLDLINRKKSLIADALLQGNVSRIVSADRMIAVKAIADASAKVGSKSLLAANDDIIKGDALSGAQPDLAILCYKDAWNKAQAAMK